MKKGCLIIIVVLAVLWVIGTLTKGSKESDSNSDDIEVRPERALATRIDNASFYYSEGGMNSSIQFTSENTGWFGAATLNQLGCRFVYGYTLEGNKILLTYTGSDCGRSSPNKTFYYNETGDYVYTMINGQKYIFK